MAVDEVGDAVTSGARSAGRTAFVLGGGGLLGASQVGMLRALDKRGIRPDLIVGTSVGAMNGAFFAGAPGESAVAELARLWSDLDRAGVFADSPIRQVARVAKHRTHLHSPEPLRRVLTAALRGRFEDLAIPFSCVAANIEYARPTWFDSGPLVDAVMASCAVPGLLPPARIGGQHYFDGGLVASIPLGRAVRAGAREIYVLQVGRAERSLSAPRWPWEVGVIAFEIARRAHFTEQMDNLPDDVQVHLLPSGPIDTPLVSWRYRRTTDVADRMELAYAACEQYLDGVEAAAR
ncbi:MAG TPA: patatin-like phospholipase family protein [Kineosporiaceae bacterium]